MKRLLMVFTPLLFCLPAFSPANAWEPTKPIEIVVGFAPGGGSDQSARLIAGAAQELFPVPLVVNNKPGAGGVLAATQFVNLPADGYSLLVAGGSDTTSVPAHRKVPYKDFTSIIRLTNNPFFLIVNKDSPYHSVEDVIKAAKEKPGSIALGNAGVGTLAHSIGLILEKSAGIKLKHVPYQGGAPTIQALVAGQIDVAAGATEEIEGQVQAGTVRVLAATSAERSGHYPDVPTLKERGFDVVITNMKGLVAPLGLPQEIVDYLHDHFHKAMENPKWQEYSKRVGEPTNYQNAKDFHASQVEQLERVRAAIGK